MLCQECQEREASLHFTKIINGEKTEFHVCDVCAKDKGEYLPGGNSFSIHQLLSGLLDTGQSFAKSSKQHSRQQAKPELQCKTCGLTYKKFAENGRFGCADCYQYFDEKLDPVLKRIHGGNSVHAGKIPKRKGKDMHVYREIEDLKAEMQNHIAAEEFEEAAKIRDQIRSLESSLHKKGGDVS
ncbi:UvrB/UvrC motif-containing protein [Alkalicoccus daliensis]|uniref:Protein-arginine kinase activator protein McsA n=1 Tax=Alkalicoccus daliensis TaxID=745820 RepID=A0A1H0L655_9BACI|nr:UvrB/UvrC motif-containing protein [Alkalicoccus daliensis]SDO63451.1 Protein-arginine kinase activator protein McsA [Alkalicoccus daliensis]